MPVAADAVRDLPLAEHLGFITRVPKDADLFVAGYGADRMSRDLVASIMDENPEDQDDEFASLLGRLGGEHFLMVGAGAGRKFELLFRSYREFSASITGTAVGGVLDHIDKDGFDPAEPSLGDLVPKDSARRWLEVMVKDGRLEVPSIVAGWFPEAGEKETCLSELAAFVSEAFQDAESAEAVSFQSCGGDFTGFVVSGEDVFREAIENARDEISKLPQGAGYLDGVPADQVDEFLNALRDLRFTMASGTVDGRVLLYIGNGTDGLRLAATPEESLAGTPALRWTSAFAEQRTHAVFYLSEAMVASMPALLDHSPEWNSLAAAVREPIREQRAFREILHAMAGNSEVLAKRDASPLTIVCYSDEGLRLESRGGWPHPGLDYEKPLAMADVALVDRPVMRAHWMQSRARNHVEWSQVENYGALIEAIAEEILVRNEPGDSPSIVPVEEVRRGFREVREMNRAYREEFREGVGDEVAVIVDLKGEVPAIPGITEEEAERIGSIPRFLVARPVRDRAKIDACGKSLETQWRGLTAWASEISGNELPLLVPQSIESGGLVTWYPPAPFIGGDFVPGVTMNDDLWMLGTSRSLASGFAKAVESASGGEQTGVVVDIDFAPVRDWFGDVYRRNQIDFDKSVDESLAEARDKLGKVPDGKWMFDSLRRLEGIHYRHRMEDGVPRSSLHIRVSEAGE
ncbi:MAG: hypothetical protein H7A49_11660 [Akkermansiaceae bacterium]|nr:hypothetical protein [Akkermansiaceae bacterium]MCP5546399.1 hypothetical protein [Akkermansiaceae bacterium]